MNLREIANAKPLDIKESLLIGLEGLSKAFEQIRIFHNNLKPEISKNLILIGNKGWFIDIAMPFETIDSLGEELNAGNENEVDDFLITYYEEKLLTIEQSIIEKFPTRKHIIQNAMNSHRREEYTLSILSFFAQADGICNEITGHSLFMNKNEIKKYIADKEDDSFSKALLSPLTIILPISANKNERKNGMQSDFNRHLILHGESINYGTKINSLKCISLLNYVAHFLELDINFEKSNQ